MHGTALRSPRRYAAVSVAVGLLLAATVGVPGAGAHPGHEDPQSGGIGVQVHSPGWLSGFRTASQWDGTAPVADQNADLVYAGTGCTPLAYATVEVAGKIALVDAVEGQDLFDVCPVATFKQKMELAEQLGAIGLVQVSDTDEPAPGNAIDSGIPGLELTRSDGAPIRDAVLAGAAAVNVTLTSTHDQVDLSERLSNVACVDGRADVFECDGIDLLGFVPHAEFAGDTDLRQLLGGGVSDLWGWTDPDTGDEYVIIGKTNGVAFFRITDPTAPVHLGELPNRALLHQHWHDIKVYDDHAFIVSESNPHGMAVFDLTRLRGVEAAQTWTEDGLYPLPVAAHNLEINTDTGFAYIVGGNAALVVPDQCLSGLHMVDVSTPTLPVFAGCYTEEGGPGTLGRTLGEPVDELSPAAYVHDTQCVLYDGPDTPTTPAGSSASTPRRTRSSSSTSPTS
ncbi:MAG: choice-of-anchor B family protein [Egibacteraceae bacterium]